MRNLANFLIFQIGWFACVVSASKGDVWTGAIVASALVGFHLYAVAPASQRRQQARLIGLTCLLGTLADSGLHGLDVLRYPTSAEAWGWPLTPPWISALWALFATLPSHSLGWLKGRRGLAFALGALGGPASFLAGTYQGVIATGDRPWLTLVVLSAEYALFTTWLVCMGEPKAEAR